MIELRVDAGDLARAQALLAGVHKGIEKAVTRALNKTATAARTKVIRRIAAETSLLQKVVRRAVTLRRASWKVWQAIIGIRGRPLPLIWFRARQTRIGVTFQLRKSEGRKTAEHAFLATMPSGWRGVYRRTGRRRLPIKQLFGPSIREVFANAPGLAEQTVRETGAQLHKELNTQVALLLRGAGTAMPGAAAAGMPTVEAGADVYAYLGSLAASVRRLEAA